MPGAAAAMARKAIGGSWVVTGDTNIVVDGDVAQRYSELSSVEADLKVISGQQAFERIGAAFRLNLKQLETNMEQARVQSNQFFQLTLVFCVLGFIVILAAVVLLLRNQVTGGMVASVSSIIPEVTALLFFAKDRELRKTMNTYHHRMLESQRVHTMIDVAETMVIPTERDKMKQEIIIKVLEIG